jgi:hypothetical protein
MRFVLLTLILLSSSCVLRTESRSELGSVPGEHPNLLVNQQINVDGVTEVEFKIAGQLHLIMGGADFVQIVGEQTSAGQIRVVRQADKLLIESNGPGSLTAYLPAQAQGRLIIDGPASLLENRNQENRLLITLNEHQRLKIDKIEMQAVSILMDGHGNLDVAEVISDRLELRMKGHGKIRVGQIDSVLVEVSMQGHGDIELSGITLDQQIKINGHGRYDAKALESSHTELIARGFNATELWVKDDLLLDAREFSAIHYRGKPEVKSTGWHHLAEMSR